MKFVFQTKNITRKFQWTTKLSFLKNVQLTHFQYGAKTVLLKNKNYYDPPFCRIRLLLSRVFQDTYSKLYDRQTDRQTGRHYLLPPVEIDSS